jgi:hypothetical protein
MTVILLKMLLTGRLGIIVDVTLRYTHMEIGKLIIH